MGKKRRKPRKPQDRMPVVMDCNREKLFMATLDIYAGVQGAVVYVRAHDWNEAERRAKARIDTPTGPTEVKKLELLQDSI